MKNKYLSSVLCILMAIIILSGCSSSVNYMKSDEDAKNYIRDVADNNYQGSIHADYQGNTEEYRELVENKFVSVANNPLSTFSADVDTASYSNLRRMIEDGYNIDRIPAGAVRTEEMINYFNYNYNMPNGSEPFGVTAQISTCPWNTQTKLLVLGLQTKQMDYSEAPPSNLVFLIDVSGSMNSDDKIKLLKQSFSYLVANLDEKDTVSIVTYSGREEVVLNGANGSDSKKILDAVNSLKTGGSTNGQAGLEKAYTLAQKNFIEGGNNRIIMASDGDLNVGITSTSDLYDYVSQKRKSGIYLSVLGFGSGNYKDTKMETLADNGNGNYFYIDSIKEASKVFGSDLTATLLTVADDVKLQVEFNPAFVKGYRLIGYENRMLDTEDFENDTIDACEVGTGHSVTVAYEIIPSDSKMEIPETDLKYQTGSAVREDAFLSGEWLTLSIRYKNPGEDNSNLLAYPIGDSNYTETPSDDYKFVSSVIELAMILHNSEYIGTASIDSVIKTLRGIDTSDESKKEFLNLVNKLG